MKDLSVGDKAFLYYLGRHPVTIAETMRHSDGYMLYKVMYDNGHVSPDWIAYTLISDRHEKE